MNHTHKFRLRMIILAMLGVACLTSTPHNALAGEPSWWTQMKNDCRARGGRIADAYNTAVAQGGCQLPSQSSPSSPAYDDGADRRRQEAEQERQRQAEADRIERERLAEEKRKADFIRDRDATASTLRGGIGTSVSPNAPGAELRGSRVDTGIRELQPDRTNRDLGGQHAAWKQLHCAASILSPAILALRLNEPGGRPDFTEFRYLANEAINALSGQRLRVACAQAPEFPQLSSRTPDMDRVINNARRTVERAQQLTSKLEEAQRKQRDATEAMNANRPASSTTLPPPGSDVAAAIAAQRRINQAGDAAGNEMARTQREFNEGKKSEEEAKRELKKIQDVVQKVEGGVLGFEEESSQSPRPLLVQPQRSQGSPVPNAARR